MDKIANFEKEGDLPATIVHEWIKMRFTAASQMKISTTVAALIGLPTELDNFGSVTEVSLDSRFIKFEYEMISDSHKNPKKFRDELDQIELKLTLESPLCLIRPKEGESFDVGIAVLDPKTNKTMFFFFDEKSSREGFAYNRTKILKDVNNPKLTDFPKNGSQYLHTKKMMQDRQFFYYYLTTKNIKSFFLDNLVQLGRENTLALVGPILDELYLCGRNTNSNDQVVKEILKVRKIKENNQVVNKETVKVEKKEKKVNKKNK